MANPIDILATAIETILFDMPLLFSFWVKTLRAMKSSVFNDSNFQ